MQPILRLSRHAFSSLRIRNYRLYFIGQAISLSGTWMQTIAQGWLVLQITGSGTQLGLVVALQFLPLLLLGPWGGLVADRYNKQTILYFTNATSGLLSFFLSLAVFSGHVQLWELYVFALGLGLVRLFDNPARQTFVSEMVDVEHLKNAVSLNATANNLARAIGPSIGGILIAGVGIAFCFLINALSFSVAIYLQYCMRADELRVHTPKPRQKNELRAGFTYAWQTPLIRNTLVMMLLVGTFVFEFQVSLPIFAQHTFHGDAATYALLMSALGLGAVTGGLFAAARRSISPRHLVIFLFLTGTSLIAASLMPNLTLATVAIFIVGFFTINVTSLANTMIQLESDPRMRGRIMALWSMAMMGSTPIGGPIVGFIGDTLGGRFAIAIGGIAAFLAGVFGIMMLRRAQKKRSTYDVTYIKAKKMTSPRRKVM